MNTDKKIITVGAQEVDLSRPVVMAVVNITPDSFWKGSRCYDKAEALENIIDTAVRNGAAILDVGGYSSRPGAEDVPPMEELRRVSMAVEMIRRRYPDVTVSLDTFRSYVAKEIIERFGPCIVNDISAGELDPDMIPAVASLGVPYIAMHMRGNPRDMQDRTGYGDIAAEVRDYLAGKATRLREAGIRQIILDPGFGFAKTTEENYRLMDGLDRICGLGYPVLSGISRKSMIYKALGTTAKKALPGTIALNWESLRKGASIIRVHDVKDAAETVRLYNFYRDAVEKID